MICVYCASHVPALLTLDIPGYEGKQVLLVAFLIIVVQGSDVLQYVFGKLFGRHKVAPLLSPSKTWEGLVGGVASATALGHGAVVDHALRAVAGGGAFAFAICVMGFLGGLVMSGIKRDRGVKDWGTHDRRARRRAGPDRQHRLLGADLLPPDALLVGAVGPPRECSPTRRHRTRQ